MVRPDHSLFVRRQKRKGGSVRLEGWTHFDRELQMDYYKKVLGEESKNHKLDSENLANCGIIPCTVNKFGVNPGLVLDVYLSHLNPKCEYLFQQPRRASKFFLLDEPETTVLYETTKVGVNKTGEMLKNLTKLVGIDTAHQSFCESYWNHSP